MLKHTYRFSLQSVLFFLILVLPFSFVIASGGIGTTADLTSSTYGIIAIIVFVLAYSLVIGEEFLHLRKSKPVLIAAGIIWVLVGMAYNSIGEPHTAGIAVKHNIEEYAELLLFLLAAMTYINALEERNVFDALRAWLVSKGFSLKTVFWITGFLAFIISPIADNLTTALLMAAVAMAVGAGNKTFIVLACINIVVAANAGGAFSPFGDITTLMVWQKGIVQFDQFFALLIPSLVNWLIPAFIMSFSVPKGKPAPIESEVIVKRGGYFMIGLFLFTIIMAVSFHNFLHLPPVLGMMTGLGLLKLFAFYLKKRELSESLENSDMSDSALHADDQPPANYDIFNILARAEWDTLMFFYGVILCVGGLGTLGYLAMISEMMYSGTGIMGTGTTGANIIVGVLSAIVDNIPVMFAVLTMNPDMSLGQWLLVTLTAGVGGSLLSIGSAAGVALMGQARGVYTFFAHMKWSWAIALGYAASIWVHLWLNADLMTTGISAAKAYVK
ncbi:sodium:proton antiporter NhaD [sulfur-oxidizing endosymbiont of Gigantopelta aegis]|uniref:sodium:proton antiporter NhaD n=1 Tax=sulfur-oxidizing endosymbiont of Gigantopelta aegis TaxID=2794934 RepID=UPI0018DE5FB3|nr:sodium:proton antiporter NhaD [sulfur-oxidizing endosymbiont of Gigantopelta aegis]